MTTFSSILLAESSTTNKENACNMATTSHGNDNGISNSNGENNYTYDAYVVDLEYGRKQHQSKRCRHKNSLVIETPVGVTLRGKYQLRAAVQMVFFSALLIGCGLFQIYNKTSSSFSLLSQDMDAGYDAHALYQQMAPLRFLQEQEAEEPTALPEVLCSSLDMADSWWMTALYIIGILYTFLALAIVCDEFFVPALEELSGPRRMNLSMDVAGATLMAAGGSAPELATSLIGTFRESEIGFGTIVGSAVFNVLFVIGMCSILAKEVLTLTWWPLFRDTSYYTVGLIVLAVFTGFTSKNYIEWWEALILFLMYFGYILLMWQNKNLYKAVTGKVLEYPDEDDDDDDDDHNKKDERNNNRIVVNNVPGDVNIEDVNEVREKPAEDSSTETTSGAETRPEFNQETSKSSIHSQVSQSSAKCSEHSSADHPHFRWQGAFRAGILKLLKDGDSWLDIAGSRIVSKIIGDANCVFEQVDKDGNGNIDEEELRQLFDLLECHATAEELHEVFVQLDTDDDGVISRKEFTEWYCRAEERMLSQVRHVFDQIDVDKSNTLDKEELKTLLATLDPHVSDEDVHSAFEEMYAHGDPNEITYEEFREWYKKSMIYERQKQLIEENIDGVFDNLRPPKDGSAREWVWYIICLPLVFVLTFTIPDVQRPGLEKWCYASFLLSIIWIGLFSYVMVDWAEVVGNTIGIPADIMGLTVLAAGTSVPDLFSSVIVARRGQGDMAISSSIGSNIFDILVGLPLPWLLYSAANNGKEVYIGSTGLLRSLLILIGMLVLVVGTIHCQGWKLTKILGGIMFLFYIAFLVQAIVFELPFDICIS